MPLKRPAAWDAHVIAGIVLPLDPNPSQAPSCSKLLCPEDHALSITPEPSIERPLQSSTDGDCKFSVCQPGSSVATALSEGEARPKHCYLLEVKGDQYRLVSQALDTVRPFVFESVRRS